MGRTPCCEKMGMKKGPWTPEEDEILISYVQRYGHQNWRALPREAGLLRCGKSCRLRWTNYLRPDIKRGNFSLEEKETIARLHEALGNRWSAIATKLPGRTDNEIKNFWHTHLKKKDKRLGAEEITEYQRKIEPPNFPSRLGLENEGWAAMISTQGFCDNFLSSDSSSNTITPLIKEACMNTSGNHAEVQEPKSSSITREFRGVGDERHLLLKSQESGIEPVGNDDLNVNNDMVFWYNVFIKSGDQSQGN